jgi:hypothetical protein
MKFDDGIDLSQSTQTLDNPGRREAAGGQKGNSLVAVRSCVKKTVINEPNRPITLATVAPI